MKPMIYKFRGAWYCIGYGIEATGDSPKQSYKHWDGSRILTKEIALLLRK